MGDGLSVAIVARYEYSHCVATDAHNFEPRTSNLLFGSHLASTFLSNKSSTHMRLVGRKTMLKTIALVLLVLWAIGFIGFSSAVAGFIHALLVAAVILFVADLIIGAKRKTAL
jgi:uncharacterized membrane protein YtjA (UPF0391 family)